MFKGEETGVKRKGVAGGVAVVLGCSSLVFGRARGGKLLVVAGLEEMRKVLLWWLWSSGGVEDGWCGDWIFKRRGIRVCKGSLYEYMKISPIE